MKILSAPAIRAWDAYTIQHEPITSLALMERAANACVQWLINYVPAQKHFKIFCGKGNNGGDGLAIACQLLQHNISVEVFILEMGAPGTHDFQRNLTRLHTLTSNITFIQSKEALPVIGKTDIVIDALYGTGVNRPLVGLPAQLVNWLNNSAAIIISIDVPSGLAIDNAIPDALIIQAVYTLTFQVLKLAFLLPENEKYTGEIVVLPIALHPDFLRRAEAMYTLIDAHLVASIFQPRQKFAHKGTYGHALIIAGARGKMGAAILAGKGCARAGAGLVTLQVPGDEMAIVQVALPEAMAIPANAAIDFSLFKSLGLGPGMGINEDSKTQVADALLHFTKPMVIDADALNILAADKSLWKNIPAGSILTPHPKEFERLFGKTANSFEAIQYAITFAKQTQCYIIVKGHHTFIATPGNEHFFNSTGNAGMAKGGSGDVLTGILAGLLAQGYTGRDACIIGVYMHGLAGDYAAKKLSQQSMLATDLIENMGNAFIEINSYVQAD